MKSIVAAVICLTMVGVCSASEQEPPVLESADWRLSRYLGQSGSMERVPSDVRISARMRDGKVQGKAGCNSYFGTYTWRTDGRLAFSAKMGATMMACPPQVADLEQRYLSLLPSVTGYRLKDGVLILSYGDETILEYIAHSPLALENVSWQAAGINNGRGGVVSSSTTGLASALFSDGRVTGSAGCNAFDAAYKISADRITIGPAKVTRKYCGEPEGIMAQEQQYLRALERVQSYHIRSDRLELRDGEGSLQISFLVVR